MKLGLGEGGQLVAPVSLGIGGCPGQICRPAAADGQLAGSELLERSALAIVAVQLTLLLTRKLFTSGHWLHNDLRPDR